MTNHSGKILILVGITAVLFGSIPLDNSFGAETPKQETPVYGTCTPAKCGGEFQAAICLLKQMCPTCDFGTLNKNNIKIVATDHKVNALYITTDRLQSYGLISAKGKVEARIAFGAIDDLCLADSRNTTFSGHALNPKICVSVTFTGKPRGFTYPPKFNELFKGVSFILNGFDEDLVDRTNLTIAGFTLTKSAFICGNRFPKGTFFMYHTIAANIPYEVTLPEGAALADGRKPKENETIDLTDSEFKCAITIREKMVESGG